MTVDPAGAAFSHYPAGSEVSLPRIAGHRDADSTDCPATPSTASCPAIRARSRFRAPVQATIALQRARRRRQQRRPPRRRRAQLFGTLTLLDGTPLAGQPVTLQSRSVSRRGEVVVEHPLAQVVTNAEGQWTLPAGPAPARPRWLRALFEGSGAYGAAVSEAIRAPRSRRRRAPRLAPASERLRRRRPARPPRGRPQRSAHSRSSAASRAVRPRGGRSPPAAWGSRAGGPARGRPR